MKTERYLEKLLAEVETLCRLYVGKDAESEQWGQTLDRLQRIDKALKAYRRACGRAEVP